MILCLQVCASSSDYEYYNDTDEPEITETDKFQHDREYDNSEEPNYGHEPSEYDYDDIVPYDNLEQLDTITIEQFVNELKRRKKAKGQQKETTKKTKGSSLPVSKGNTKSKIAKKVNGEKKQSQRKQKISSKKKRKQGKNNPKNKANKQPISSKSQKKPNFTKTPKNKVKAKPSRKQKPFHKPKSNKEEEDFFQIGNSESHQHSDHHIHQHDHLEAHKHHHKHKESHDHAHDHANDHEHNHKHTHNHVHNHIHKHNEAHEHTAEHAHTEKHHHKHLEYIDAGGWRRRNDGYSETMLESEPVDVIMESRGMKDPEVNVKSYLKNIIAFYKDVVVPNNVDESKDVSIEEGDSEDIDEPIVYAQHVNKISEPSSEKNNSEYNEEYTDYSPEYPGQFSAEYEGEEYYDDQNGYGSNTDEISKPFIELNSNKWVGMKSTKKDHSETQSDISSPKNILISLIKGSKI